MEIEFESLLDNVMYLLVTAFGKCTEWLGIFFNSIDGIFTIFITFFIILLGVKRLLGPLLGSTFASGSSDTVKPTSIDKYGVFDAEKGHYYSVTKTHYERK